MVGDSPGSRGIGDVHLRQARLRAPSAGPEPEAAEHDRARDAVLATVEARELLDRHPVVQRTIRLRNPYVDPINAIQVELLRRWRDPPASAADRERVRRPLARTIAGIAAGLRNTG